jgi:hypothetical protein
MTTVVIVSLTMLTTATKSLEAQSLRIERGRMLPELEALVEETVKQQVDAIITLEPLEHGQTVPRERLLVSEALDENWAPVTRAVHLPESSINLEVMPPALEDMVQEKVGPQVDTIIALGSDGQEHTLLAKEYFSNPDDPGTVILQDPSIGTPEQVTPFVNTLSGVGYLRWEASPE